jgi:predicted TIM-barrel fold metal-dependent hydrolase
MPDFSIIDAHVHTYRSREIGRQAMMGTGQTDYGGTVDELLGLMARAGIHKAVMVNMTPVVEMADAALAKLSVDLSPSRRVEAEDDIRRQMIGRLQRRNDWTCEVARQNPQLVAYISLDPSMSEEELVAEIDLRREQGASGIKLHPANQRFYPNDRRLWPAYDRAQELGFPIIFHSGTFPPGLRTTEYAHPKHFPDVFSAFPSLTAVMAHLAFGHFAACADLARAHPNVFFDCCGVINGTEKQPALSDEEAVAALRQVGTERVMFGSDYPWFDPVLDADRIQRLPLTEPEKRAILHDNAQRILAL